MVLRVLLLLLNIIPLRNPTWFLIHGLENESTEGLRDRMVQFTRPYNSLEPAFHLCGGRLLGGLSVTEYIDFQCIVPKRIIRLFSN